MKIVYIIQNSFTERDYYRYGIDELIKKSKLEVEIWDVSKILYPKIDFNYQSFKNISISKKCFIKSFSDINELKSKLSSKVIFYCMVLVEFNFKSLPIFKTLSENKIKCVGTGIGMINIQPEFNYSLLNTKSIIKKIFNLTLRRVLSNIKRSILIFLIKFYKINFYEIFFLSGGIKTSVDNILVSNYTDLVRLHSNNYDLHLKKYKSYDNKIDYDYDVYIDQNITRSSDSIIRKINLLIPAKKYYNQLNIFFDKLEKVTGRKIVISAHPKANLKELRYYNPKREIINNVNSASLVYFSKNVIVSYSMAMGFACLYNKNVIFITNSSINDYKRSIINGISKYFNINYINISEKYTLHDNYINEKSQYSKYIKDFLTPSSENKTLFSVQIFNYITSKV